MIKYHKDLFSEGNLEEDPNSRQHPRKICYESTFFSTEGGLFEGLIENIGAKGVFLKSNGPVILGDTITVAVPSSRDTKGIKLKGKIVWKNQYGFGVDFNSKS